MNILHVIQDFPHEESCIDHFRLNREQHGIICKKCAGQKHYWLKAKSQWHCAQCNFRTTIRSGTVMQGSNLPLRKWYLAMAFMTATKKGVSAKELQRQLQHKRYDTIWSLMHRIRNAMGNREDSVTLQGIVQFNESYFLHAQPDGRKLKRGKIKGLPQNTQDKEIALASLCTDEEKTITHYWKMEVKNAMARKKDNSLSIDFGEMYVGLSKKSKGVDLSQYVHAYNIGACSAKEKSSKNSWGKIMVANARRVILGIYHRIKGKYVQLYLDEFCFKLNRRDAAEGLFQQATMAVSQSFW